MNRIAALLLALLMVFSFSACKNDEKEDILVPNNETQADQIVETKDEQEAELVEQDDFEEGLNKCLEKYSSVLNEDFGATWDENDYCYRLYMESDTDYSEIAGMISYKTIEEKEIEADEKGLQHYAGFVVDPAYAACYVVLDYYDLESFKSELSGYMDDSIFMESFENNFIEYDGFVYLVRGGRGYGSESIKDAVISEQTADKIVMKADRYLFDEKQGTTELTFSIETHRDPIIKLEKAVEK